MMCSSQLAPDIILVLVQWVRAQSVCLVVLLVRSASCAWLCLVLCDCGISGFASPQRGQEAALLDIQFLVTFLPCNLLDLLTSLACSTGFDLGLVLFFPELLSGLLFTYLVLFAVCYLFGIW